MRVSLDDCTSVSQSDLELLSNIVFLSIIEDEQRSDTRPEDAVLSDLPVQEPKDRFVGPMLEVSDPLKESQIVDLHLQRSFFYK